MEHLELSADSDDLTEREEHRVIAKWLKHFIGATKDLLVESARQPVDAEPDVETAHMDFDSDGGETPSTTTY